MNIERVVVVAKKTRLEELVERFQTVAQARFYLKQAGEDFDPIEGEHDRFKAAEGFALSAVPRGVRVHRIDRDLLGGYRFDRTDLVMTLGPDGLVVNVAKYLDGQPIIAVNPDPKTVDGILLPTRLERCQLALRAALEGRAIIKRLTMAEARLADGQRLLAVNDLFIGARTHVSSRYRIGIGGAEERHSSSGIIVSTGVGSTGWMRSVHVGATRLVGSLTGREIAAPEPMPWDSLELKFAVREPFPSVVTGTSLVYGRIADGERLNLASEMAGNGVIFSDGIESDSLDFNQGAVAAISVARERVSLVTS